ncbi:hypothetical protein PMAYCL1PPCAC_22224, partial [Pristionchus mayeri]
QVTCLEKALNALADKIGGVARISTLVTDRHGAVIKMMRDRFPSIRHFFDPWHYFRNLTMSLLKITKPNYMTTVKFWTRRIINKAYDSVVKAQGDGTVASEMFRSTLHCMCGVHDFSSDPSFTTFKKCLHSPPSPGSPTSRKTAEPTKGSSPSFSRRKTSRTSRMSAGFSKRALLKASMLSPGNTLRRRTILIETATS